MKLFALFAASVLFLSACNQAPTTTQAGSPSAAEPAATATSGTAAADAQKASANADIEPAATAALERMSTYLRTLKAFQINSRTERDDVLDNGQTIAVSGSVDMLVQLPDRLRAEVIDDNHHRTFYYDGKSFTLWAQLVNYYATVPAPTTVAELASVLDEKYGVDIPLADLFYWGGKKSTSEITSATDIGPSTVNGVTCEHYAFRQPGADWQVWIQLGDFPLPRKLEITTLTDDARPQFTSVIDWNLAPSYNAATFVFDPPADAKKIAFAPNADSK